MEALATNSGGTISIHTSMSPLPPNKPKIDSVLWSRYARLSGLGAAGAITAVKQKYMGIQRRWAPSAKGYYSSFASGSFG